MNKELIIAINKIQETDREYAQTLRSALMVVGVEELSKALSEAQKTGKKVDLTYPIPFEDGPSEPDGIILVPSITD